MTVPDGPSKCSPTSTSSTNSSVCRFCHCGEKSGNFFSCEKFAKAFCRCRGTTGMYHKSCMEHWLMVSKTDFCDICKAKFIVKRSTQPFTSYLRNQRCGKMRNIENSLLAKFLCFIIFTPIMGFSVFSFTKEAVIAAQQIGSENPGNGDESKDSPLLKLIVYAMMAVMFLGVYSGWLVAVISIQLYDYRAWQKKNMLISIRGPATHLQSQSRSQSRASPANDSPSLYSSAINSSHSSPSEWTELELSSLTESGSSEDSPQSRNNNRATDRDNLPNSQLEPESERTFP
ncbi:hypothetical protein WR25_07640 [Diploscapter pachys]|uniref:RING-CH-type domain-containing protein n=1 Tax=Diploscapter pachys TaxID=2018661 RepID=A0A2A2KXV7_9BILA|nr:hypothetical protein WR25_07640 [Diploscapter pachys]